MDIHQFIAAEEACSDAIVIANGRNTAAAIADMHIALAVNGLIATQKEHKSTLARLRLLATEPGKKLDYFWIIPAQQATL